MSHITTQLYLPWKAKNNWGCPKISTVQRREREGRQERRLSQETGGRVEEKEWGGEAGWQQEGKRAKLISQRAYRPEGRSLWCLLSFFGFDHWVILAGQREWRRKRERPHFHLCLQRLLCVAPCSSFISRLDREKRETPTSKDSLISEVHRRTT